MLYNFIVSASVHMTKIQFSSSKKDKAKTNNFVTENIHYFLFILPRLRSKKLI